jgi:hypothetical protein
VNGSRRFKKISAKSVFDFDDPKIDIEGDFAPQPLVSACRIDPIGRVKTAEVAIAALDFALRRRAVECAATIEPVDLHEDRAGFGGPAATQHRADAGNRAAAKIGRHPKIASDPHPCFVFSATALKKRNFFRNAI